MGPLETIEDLARVEVLGFESGENMVEQMKNHLNLTLRNDQFPLVTNNHLVQWELCKQGAGVCLMTEPMFIYRPLIWVVFEQAVDCVWAG